jgi:cyclopropane fatty-acyl-phospholipid synthase-like methyltransferase
VQRPNVEFLVGHAADIATIAKRIEGGPDVVAAFELLEHLPPTKAEAFLSKVRQTLRERGGWFVGTTPNAERRRRPGVRAHHHSREFGPSELADRLRTAGVVNVAVSGLYLQPKSRRLEHYANTIPFQGLFRSLARRGESKPKWCRTLVFRAQAS